MNLLVAGPMVMMNDSGKGVGQRSIDRNKVAGFLRL